MTRDHVPTNPKWPLRRNDVLVRGSTGSSTHPPSAATTSPKDELRLQRECCTAPDSPEWRLSTMQHTRRATTQ
ncbi:hypothetical protein NDU88_004062 [Pleurodeles waltl]|uniref:Uncharacterized protein n=1 Tax=Pleurodeles waltl TaxID=8319 RepID=A0AAV7WUJ6_PLEWA|nr:hypothetical protein NDU88_004062 [Pleurodeles waltl]